MSNDMSKTVREFYRAVEGVTAKDRKGGYDTQATVRRIEDGIAWVHIPEGVDETPAKLTISAKEGDIVQVRVVNGRAFLVGNASAPPTDDKEAIIALQHANDASKAASIARVKAEEATEDAERAHEAADAAQTSADTAATAAANAQDSANAAQESADAAAETAGQALNSAVTANTAANNALTQLSVVEDVVGVLSWISEHGTYIQTSDTAVEVGKFYFFRSGAGTTADPYVYSLIPSPSGDPSAQGWYEIDSIDEAVSNYVSSHLALTDAGLWVTKDNNGYKILLANDGMKVYDPLGELVATFGQNVSFSGNRTQYIGNENAYIVFNPADGGSLNIGGTNVTFEGSRTLSEILDTVQKASDLAVLRIDSSRGTVFKNNQISTVMTVTIYKADGTSITNITQLHAAYGAGAYLQWYWRRIDDSDYGIIPSSDTKLSDSGFTLTLTPSDVDTKVTFRCELITLD